MATDEYDERFSGEDERLEPAVPGLSARDECGWFAVSEAVTISPRRWALEGVSRGTGEDDDGLAVPAVETLDDGAVDALCNGEKTDVGGFFLDGKALAIISD